MESSEWPVVSMDFGRPEVMIVPILAFFSSLVKGLSGMGEALVYGAGWQLFYLAGFEEMNNLGLLAGLICVLQCTSTALLAFGNWQQWSAELHLMLSSMLCFRLFDDCVLSQNGRRIGSIDCFMPLHCGRRHACWCVANLLHCSTLHHFAFLLCICVSLPSLLFQHCQVVLHQAWSDI